MVDCREKEIEDLKRTAMTLNREKALLMAADRNKAIESGMRESQVERKQIERELVIPRGLAETDADAGADGSPDAGFDAGAGVDGGGADSGVIRFDGGPDAGVDSGLDGGVDAGFDGGFDAGVDGGFEASADEAVVGRVVVEAEAFLGEAALGCGFDDDHVGRGGALDAGDEVGVEAQLQHGAAAGFLGQLGVDDWYTSCLLGVVSSQRGNGVPTWARKGWKKESA